MVDEIKCRKDINETYGKKVEFCNGICSSSTDGSTRIWWLCCNRRVIQKDEKVPYFCKRWHSNQKQKDGINIEIRGTSVNYYYENRVLEPDQDRKLSFDPIHKIIYDNSKFSRPVVDLIGDYASGIQVASTKHAFAVIWEDGTLSTWTERRVTNYRDFKNVILDEAVLDEIRVDRIYSNRRCFVAKLMNGSFVSWGFFDTERPHIPIEEIQEQLVDVEKIYSNDSAFVAKLSNGSVVAWGEESSGGKIPKDKQKQLVDVEEIYSNDSAFVAKLSNGSVVAWGEESSGGKIPGDKQKQLVNVETIYSFIRLGFVAKLSNGSVVAWGNHRIEIPTDKQTKLVKVEEICWNYRNYSPVFAAKLVNGSVVGWGADDFEIPEDKQKQLVDVAEIYSNQSAFIAKLINGKVVCWTEWGPNCRFDEHKLAGVTEIYSDKDRHFVIRLDTGSALMLCD